MPPWLEHAPRPPFDIVPSVQATFVVLLLAGLLAAAVAFASTPPCPEQAPRPVAAEVDPSVHTEPEAWAIACVDNVQSAAMAAEANRSRTRMIELRE
jgi:hypothetical protein